MIPAALMSPAMAVKRRRNPQPRILTIMQLGLELPDKGAVIELLIACGVSTLLLY